MRNLGIKGKTVSIKIRLQDFDTYTRSRTVKAPVNDMQTVRTVVLELYRQFSRGGRKVRLVGVSVSNLDTSRSEAVGQFELFSEESIQQNESDEDSGAAFKSRGRDELLDEMKRMYGEKITRAAFLKNPSEKKYPES
jgi:DNA polymerase-4